MDSQIPNTRMRGRRSRGKKISLEDYLCFTESHNQIDLTVNQIDLPVNHLNQIVSMHGFNTLQGVPKKGVVEAVNSINLMNLPRSTLKDNNISSKAFITTEEVIADLKDLNWTECHVSSIQIINSLSTDHGQLLLLENSKEQSISKESSIAVDDANAYDGFSNSNSINSSNIEGSATKLKQKRKRIGGIFTQPKIN